MGIRSVPLAFNIELLFSSNELCTEAIEGILS